MNFIGQVFDWELFRRDVRRDVRNNALYMFLFFVAYFTGVFVVEGVYMAKNPEVLAGLLSGGDGAPGQTELTDIIGGLQSGNIVGLMSIVSIVAGSLVFLIPRKRRLFTDLALPAAERLTPKIFIVLVLATQFVQLAYGLAMTLIDKLLPEGLSLLESYGEAMEGLSTPLGIAYVVLIGPIFEELVFRGAVMGSLRRFGDNFAIIFSSLFFGFYHMVVLQIPFAFVLGLLLGYVAARWSLRAAIALHMVVNGLSTLFSDTGNEAFATGGGFFMMACSALTFIFLIKWRKALRERVRTGAAYYPRTYANGFSSIAFWVFILVMTFGGLAQMGVFFSEV